MSTRARRLPLDLIPLTLAALELPTTDAATAQADKRRAEGGYAGTLVDALRDEMRAELTTAIDPVLKRLSAGRED